MVRFGREDLIFFIWDRLLQQKDTLEGKAGKKMSQFLWCGANSFDLVCLCPYLAEGG